MDNILTTPQPLVDNSYNIGQSDTSILPKPQRSIFKNKNFISIFTLSSLIVLGSIALYLFSKNQDIRSRASTAGPVLSIVPTQKIIQQGEEFPLDIILNTGSDTVSAIELDLSYNPENLEISSFSPGKDFPVILSPEKNNNGIALVTIGVDPTKPFKGNSIVGTFNIKILHSVDSTINFTSSTKVSVLGKNVNALNSSQGSVLIANIPTQEITIAPQLTVTTIPITPTILPATTTPRPAPTNSIISINPKTLPDGYVGVSYSSNIVVTKIAYSTNPSVNISGLPFGMYEGNCTEDSSETSVSCQIVGVPPVSGSYLIDVSVVDSNNFNTKVTIPLTIH